MPRNGSGVYSLPAGSTFTPNTIIQSSVVNGINNDIATDLNTPRPIVAGGTGASTVAGAQAALGLSTGTFGFLFGLTMGNNGGDLTNSIDITVGTAATDDPTSPTLMTLSSLLTKAVNVNWAVGSGSGGLDTGTVANGTYHVFLIQRSDTGVVDALFSTSPTSPTMPANYDRKRRIGSIMRVGGNNRGFVQNGDEFLWRGNGAIVDVNVTNPGTSATTRTLSVPSGLEVDAYIRITTANSSSGGYFNTYVSYLGVSDDAVTSVTQTLDGNGNVSGRARDSSAEIRVRTNPSSQVRVRHGYSDANCSVSMTAYGWRDTRGRY
jgi:hypothetical protein